MASLTAPSPKGSRYATSLYLLVTLALFLAGVCNAQAGQDPSLAQAAAQVDASVPPEMRATREVFELDPETLKATEEAHQARLVASQMTGEGALHKRDQQGTPSEASKLKLSHAEKMPTVSGEPQSLDNPLGLGKLHVIVARAANSLKPSNRQTHFHARRAKSPGNVAVNEKVLHQDLEEGLDELIKAKGTTRGEQDRDLAKLVNAFIGTEANSNPGNVCPGASTPYGMVKFNVDVDQYAPAGYVTDLNGDIRGLSPLHDSGTGSSAGSFGNFESMPVVCPGNDFKKCPTRLDDRKRKRLAGKDEASPGYFTLTLDNSIKMEATATRRSGLIRYTFPQSALDGGKLDPHVVQDWTNDLPGTFRGGDIQIDTEKGQIRMNGSWASSFGVGQYTYRAFSCIDLLNNGKQSIKKAGLWQGDRFGQDIKLEIEGDNKHLHANLTKNSIGGQPVQAGALVSFASFPKTSDGSAEITLRVGVSFNSAEQACANAAEEIGDAWDFDAIVKQTRAAWNVKLNRFQIDPKTDKTIAELFYSSLYYAFLTPNNATSEAGNLYPGAEDYDGNYYNSLYCTWDTYRTFHPFLSLSSPNDMAEIVDNYIDGWRKNGWIPECRANNVPGLTQGGSHGVMVIADFLAKYHKFAKEGKVPVSIDDAYEAVFKDSYVTPEDWNSYGRQISVYEQYGYIPFAVFDTYSTGRQTREASRGLEYAHNDFGARTVALIAGHDDVAKDLGDRSLTYKNNFDPSVTSMGFSNFVQKRYPDGTFHYDDPTICSPIDHGKDRQCSLPQENVWGVYETSSWEYSLYCPWDEAGLITLISNDSVQNFHDRLDTFFEKGLYYSGNEPSFSTPVSYHYISRPVSSVKRVRQVVYDNFNITTSGLPGNSDQGAMQTLLLFHLLGLYPVPATKEFLVLSPFMPSYTIRNELLGDLHVTVTNFDARSLARSIPSGVPAYVEKVLINGVERSGRCKVEMHDLFPGEVGKVNEMEIVLTADAGKVDSCGPAKEDLPSSLSTGGFASF